MKESLSLVADRLSQGKKGDYTDLEVWQLGIQLAKQIYKLAESLPKEEAFGLISQMRRAAVSIPSNIAEGSRRHYQREFVQFLYQALGSLAEIETQLTLARELHHLEISFELMETTDKLGRKLRKLIQFLSANDPRP
ncbi:MAG: four helix bundle protein, partial [Elusimicrobia bacterium]|nr:four helix bundle protein [Elusimicrobiota bacterium]